MAMANGTQQRLTLKPRKTVTTIQPDAPEGKWEALIPKGKCKIVQTAAEKGGDPGVMLVFKLQEADDEKNRSFQNSELFQRVYFYGADDADHRRAANMNLQFMRGLCEATDLDFADIYPTEISEDGHELQELIEALEGKSVTIWTVHRKSKAGNGEEMINVDIRFKEPGAGLVSNDNAGDEEERPGKTKKAAGGKRR